MDDVEVNCAVNLRKTAFEERRLIADMNAQRIKVRELYEQHIRVFNDDGLAFHYCNGRDLYRGAPDLGSDWIVEWLPRMGLVNPAKPAAKMHDAYFYSPENEKFRSKHKVVLHFKRQGRDMSFIDSINKYKGWAFDVASRGRILKEVSPRIDCVLIAVGELVILGHGDHLRCLDRKEKYDPSPMKSAMEKLTVEEVKGLTTDTVTVQSEVMLLLTRLVRNPYFEGGEVECHHVKKCLDLYKALVVKSFLDRDVEKFNSDSDHKHFYELGLTFLASALRLMKMY